jgi:hypothetical protein
MLGRGPPPSTSKLLRYLFSIFPIFGLKQIFLRSFQLRYQGDHRASGIQNHPWVGQYRQRNLVSEGGCLHH